MTAAVILCHEMHWDYFTYLDQPEWFLTALREKMNLDARYQEAQSRKIKQK